jgi:Protein of unknown function (DUF4197)
MRRRFRHVRLAAAAAWIVAVSGCAGLQLGSLDRILTTPGALDERTVAAGLKEALRVGTERSVETTSRLDGFWGNPQLRIPLPEQVQGMANTLRRVGLGGQVDEFELAMNRGAEKAAGEAAPVFWDAITSMSIGEAFEILRGDDTAATTYFQERTSEALRSRFRPIVQEKLEGVGVYRAYQNVVDAYTALLQTPPSFDPTEYVTQKTLDGLFLELGKEERRIRQDPVARTTDLLQRVFGSRARTGSS